MRVVRITAMGALIAAAALATPASARVHYQRLAGDTTITATSSGTTLVDIPDDVRLSWKAVNNPDISITGSGRLVGFMLSPVKQQGWSMDSLLVLRLPKAGGSALEVFGLVSPTPGPQCKQIGEDLSEPTGGCADWKDPGYGIFYEGRYKLTVLTDGAPLTIHLDLHGLDGSTTVRPTTRVASVQSSMTPRESVGTNVVSGGTGAMTMARDGMYISYGQISRTPGSRFRQNGVCSVDGAQASLPGVYLPPICGEGGSSVIDPQQQLPADWDGLSGGLGWGSIEAGSYGMGFNATSDSPLSFVGGAVAFLPGV